MGSNHVAVASWDDIDDAPKVSDAEKQRVAQLLTETSWDDVVWVPSWPLDDPDKEVATVEASDHLAVGDVEDYSEKAWKFLQPHIHTATWGDFLPKSQVVRFERVAGVEEIDTPQSGLTAFAGGDDGA